MKKIIILIILFSTPLLFSCGGSGDSKKKETLIYGMYKEAVNLDPALLTDTASNAVVHAIFESLVGYNKDATTIVPKLAEKWKISSDNLKYTFFLRKGLTFDDGTPLNADSALFSFQRLNDKKNKYYSVSPYWIGLGMQKNIKSIDKEDDYTISFTLNQPESTFLSKMTLPSSAIINPTAYKKLGSKFKRQPSGIGPFQFVSWTKGDSIILKRNDNYYDKEHMPKVKQIIMKVVPDPSARLLALKKGEIDIAEMIQPQDVKIVQDQKDLDVVKEPAFYQNYLFFGVEKTPFNNLKVRQAIAHLIDKENIVKTAVLGYGNTVKNPIPKVMWGYDNSTQDYDYNVDKAKGLLTEAGYPNGFKMDLLYNKENADRKTTAEILQNAFAKANIKVNLITLEWGSYISAVTNRTYTGAALGGWGADYADPDNYLVMNFSAKATVKPGTNTSGWANKEFDSYNDQALKITDKDARLALYKKAQKVFHDNVPTVPLFDKVTLFGINKSIKNFYYSPLSIPLFRDVEKN